MGAVSRLDPEIPLLSTLFCSLGRVETRGDPLFLELTPDARSLGFDRGGLAGGSTSRTLTGGEFGWGGTSVKG